MVRQAWPYAVARGKSVGYQAIVVPDFLDDVGEAYLLEYFSRTSAAPGELVISAVPGSSTGPLTIVYRSVRPTAERYGIADGASLRDRSGRDVHLFEGLVLRQSAPVGLAGPSITASDIDQVTTRIAPAFRRLWEATEAIEAERSTPVPVESVSPGSEALRPQVIAGGRHLVRRGYRVAAGISAVAVLAVLGLVLSLARPLRGPLRAPVPRECPAAFRESAGLSAYPPWVRRDITLCVPSVQPSKGYVSALIRNTSDYAIQVTIKGSGGRPLRPATRTRQDPASSVADAALSPAGATNSLLLPPGDSARITTSPATAATLVFGIRSASLRYTTAVLASSYLIEHGVKASEINLKKIRGCASAATYADYGPPGPLQVDAQFTPLEKKVPSCHALVIPSSKSSKQPAREFSRRYMLDLAAIEQRPAFSDADGVWRVGIIRSG